MIAVGGLLGGFKFSLKLVEVEVNAIVSRSEGAGQNFDYCAKIAPVSGLERIIL
jgi:hypothetical protein